MKRRIQAGRGTPADFLNAVKDRIDDLRNGVIDSAQQLDAVTTSFVYPDQVEELMDGEYQSHVTEPVKAASAADAQSVIDRSDPLEGEVLEFLLTRLGCDITEKRVQNYAEAVAEYIELARTEGPYTIQDWYEDTCLNAPEELDELEACKSVVSSSRNDDPAYNFHYPTRW